jgi:RNA polymerase sigma-70 factor (ECF subfamily)
VVLGSDRGRYARPGGLTDAECIERVLDGDRQAFGELVRRYDDRMRGLAYKLLAGDRPRMDDALQEGYLKAFGSLGRFRHDAEFGSWLYRIVYNACIDELRRAGRRAVPVDTTDAMWDGPSAAAGPERAVIAADSALHALSVLPDDQRIAVVLVDGEGLDNVTAADLLGVPAGTIASRLSRGRAAMRHALDRTVE